MKKVLTLKQFLFITAILLMPLLFFSNSKATIAQEKNPLSDQLSGRILLQVESKGEAWYVNPDNHKRIFLNRPSDAFKVMKNFGQGISEENYNKFLKDGISSKFSGRIILRVEMNGEAYYVNPETLKMHYLGRPADAFKIMQEMGLGISNSDLLKIEEFNLNYQDINDNKEEYKIITAKPELMRNFTHIISLSAEIININNIKEKGILYSYTTIKENNLIPSIEDYDQKITDTSNDNIIKVNITNLKPESYSFIRAYVIDNDNKIYYGNIETIDSIGKKGTPALPISSSFLNEEIAQDEGNGDGDEGDEEEEPIQYTLTYRASNGGYVKLNDYPEWSEGGNLPFSLAGSGHLVLDDNKIFIAGGMMSNNIATSTVLIYDTASMSYTELSPMNEARAVFSIARVGNKIYVIDGLNNLGAFTQTHSAEVYDLDTNEWSYISNTNAARSSAVAAAYNGDIYSFGGFDASFNSVDVIEKYDPTLDEWTTISTSTPVNSVSFRASELIGNILYFVGGISKDRSFISNDFSSYNIATQEWDTTLADLPVSRMGGNLLNVNGKLLYFGGTEAMLTNTSDHTYEYDFITDEWRRIFNIPNTLSFSITETVGDYVYIIGGFNDALFYDTNYKIGKNRLFFVEDEVQQIVFTGDETEEVYAIPESGYVFTTWSDQYGKYVRKDDIESLSAENVILTAIFEPYTPTFNSPGDDLILKYSISAGETLTLPLKDGLATPYGKDGYNFIVDWGDGATSTISSFDDSDKSHVYAEATTTTVRIAGKFPWIYFNNNSSVNKDDLIEVSQWGNVDYISFLDSFNGCPNLSIIPNGPITGAERVENFSNGFNAANLSSIPSQLFSNTPNAASFNGTFSNNSLSSIPAGLFDNTPNAASFYDTFRDNSISSIPAGLFNNTPNAINFNGTFSNNSLSSIPAGLFDNTPNAVSFYNTFSNNSLSSIPAGLFDNTPKAVNFALVFYVNSINEIPDNLFDNVPLAANFSWSFGHNNLSTIPSGLFDHTPNVTDFSLAFISNELTSIPANLFAATIKVTSFAWSFGHNNLSTIPSGLFDHTPNVTDFSLAFISNELTSIPANLFAATTKVTNFSQTFSDNLIETIPSGLFDNNTAVENFSGILSDNLLSTIPTGLFDNNLNVTDFRSALYHNTTLTGEAPELWLRVPEPLGSHCFGDNVNLSNYADIPGTWK